LQLFEVKGPIYEIRSLSLSVSLLVLSAAPVEAQAPKRKAAAVDPMRFDLVCRVTSNTANGTETDGAALSETAIDTTFRVRTSLDSMRFCYGDCDYVYDITGLSPERVVFSDTEYPKRTANERSMVKSRMVVNRRSGRYYSETIFYDKDGYNRVGARTTEASCSKLPFSGFPAARF
jgi:hypothetical protein